MALSDMQVFNEFFQPVIHETLDQMVNEFNAASNGTIVLINGANIGNYLENSFYDAIQSSARRRVDRYAANGAVANTDLTQTEHVAVKVAGGFGPVAFEPAQMTWLRKPTAEGINIISTQFAEALLQDQLNTAILALVTAIENQGATLVNDVSGGASITQRVINGSHKLFGDMSQMLQAQVMSGAMYHTLVDQSLTNTEELFQAGNVTVVSILNKPIVVTDAPALTEAGVPDKDKVLSLCPSACVIRDPADPITNVQTNNGSQRIETTVQMDYDFTVDLKGYSWDKANGGASPDDADLATGTNWDKDVTSDKKTAGVLAIGDVA